VLAKHFTQEEDAANKVEWQVGKPAAALLLESKIGRFFQELAFQPYYATWMLRAVFRVFYPSIPAFT